MAKAPAVGIDFGTNYTAVGVFQNGEVEIIANDQGNRTTPSYVAFTETERLIGDAAKNQAAMNQTNTIFDIKRFIGRRFHDPVIQAGIGCWQLNVKNLEGLPVFQTYSGCHKQVFFPEEIGSMVLTKMKETAEAYLRKTVTDAVVAVPAHFTNIQRERTENAHTISGFNVLRIIEEPMAISVAYGLNKEISERKVLILDIGADTLDMSIVSNSNHHCKIQTSNGDVHLGGDSFDHRLVSHFVKKFKRKHNKDLESSKEALHRLRLECERVKKILSSSTHADFEITSLYANIDFSASITRARFEELNADLFEEIVKNVKNGLKSVNMRQNDINSVILVGGCTNIPKIHNMVQGFFSGKKIINSISPDHVIAYGAAMVANSDYELQQYTIHNNILGVCINSVTFFC